jgi:hypothetical protein
MWNAGVVGVKVRWVLRHYSHVRVLDFTDGTAEAFCGFTKDQDNQVVGILYDTSRGL